MKLVMCGKAGQVGRNVSVGAGKGGVGQSARLDEEVKSRKRLRVGVKERITGDENSLHQTKNRGHSNSA